MKSSSTLMLVLLVLQAVLVMGTFAALAEANGAVGKGTGKGSGVKCCTDCNYFSGVFTCKDIVSKCAPDCKKCVQVQTHPVKRFRCDDVGIDTGNGSCGPPCT